MNRLTLSIAACCLLTACAAGPTPMPACPIPVPPPANLTASPQKLPPPKSGEMRDLESNHLQAAHAYHLLATRYCGLLQWLEINDDGCKFFLAP